MAKCYFSETFEKIDKAFEKLALATNEAEKTLGKCDLGEFIKDEQNLFTLASKVSDIAIKARTKGVLTDKTYYTVKNAVNAVREAHMERLANMTAIKRQEEAV